VTTSQGDFVLTLEELRVATRYAAECAQESLAIFERGRPHDLRARAAVDAARAFVNGVPRTKLQRVASLEAHRAAKDATAPSAEAAARAAGDAAASAYLHPLARRRRWATSCVPQRSPPEPWSWLVTGTRTSPRK
jgi:hypothetical protein